MKRLEIQSNLQLVSELLRLSFYHSVILTSTFFQKVYYQFVYQNDYMFLIFTYSEQIAFTFIFTLLDLKTNETEFIDQMSKYFTLSSYFSVIPFCALVIGFIICWFIHRRKHLILYLEVEQKSQEQILQSVPKPVLFTFFIRNPWNWCLIVILALTLKNYFIYFFYFDDLYQEWGEVTTISLLISLPFALGLIYGCSLVTKKIQVDNLIQLMIIGFSVFSLLIICLCAFIGVKLYTNTVLIVGLIIYYTLNNVIIVFCLKILIQTYEQILCYIIGLVYLLGVQFHFFGLLLLRVISNSNLGYVSEKLFLVGTQIIMLVLAIGTLKLDPRKRYYMMKSRTQQDQSTHN